MQIADVITLDRIACHVKASSKKRVFELLGELLAGSQSGLTQAEIVDSLLARERLGCTGLGHGVAIPHGRLKKIDKALGAFIQLEKGIDFDASDNQPVDLLFVLLVPEKSTEEHLQLLAQLAEMFSDEGLREKLHCAQTRDELCDLVTHRPPSDMQLALHA